MTALVVLAVLAAFIAREYMRERAFQTERDGWTKERSELLSRIQHPEALPPRDFAEPSDEEIIEVPEDEYDKVGQIETGVAA